MPSDLFSCVSYPIVVSLTALTIGLAMIALAREYRFSSEKDRSNNVPAELEIQWDIRGT